MVMEEELTDNPLSLEAELEISKTNYLIDRMTLDQLREFSKMIFRHFKTSEATWRKLIAHQWGIDRGKLLDDNDFV
jgi:hypothetical protein